MNKVYKGYELIKEITEGNIKNGSRFWITIFGYNDKDGCEVIYDGEKLRWDADKDNELKLSLIKISKSTFELIEETIDIDSIGEYEEYFIDNSSTTEDVKSLARKCNKLVQAVKHLNKEIQSIKGKM